MKKLLLFLMVVIAIGAGMTWGGVTVEGASAFKSPQKPPKQVTKYKFEGENAYAEFSNADGCVSTYANLSANESVNKSNPDKGATTSAMVLTLGRFDNCTGEYLYASGSTPLAADAFSVQSNLGSATLNAEVEVCCDLIGSLFPVSVSLTWTGTGPISKGKSTYVSKSPGCKISYISQGDYRNAVASGSISGIDIQFAPQPSIFASLNNSKSGNMEVGCD